MRLCLFALALVAVRTDGVSAFVPTARPTTTRTAVLVPPRFSSVADRTEAVVAEEKDDDRPVLASPAVALSETEYLVRLEAELEKLRQKDKLSPLLTKEELNVLYEDEHIVVVDKPSGVLTVSGKDGANSLAQTVFSACLENCKLADCDRMVVHRLGFDTSGLLVFAKTIEAVRGMNTIFRSRKIERKYEALLCGHVKRDRGIIDLPLMRCYEHPPYMRISTEEHQEALISLDPEVVGKKLLEQPKQSLTKYEVIAREELGGEPVTRVTLTSISGRTHQLNTHLAAFGHPIVGDSTYGLNGIAAPNGGLTDSELKYLAPNQHRATPEQQEGANAAAANFPKVHAKSLKFRHPVSKEDVILQSDVPF